MAHYDSLRQLSASVTIDCTVDRDARLHKCSVSKLMKHVNVFFHVFLDPNCVTDLLSCLARLPSYRVNWTLSSLIGPVKNTL
jgi:hypothetical protein